MAKLISQVYGHALFCAAVESGNIDIVYEEAVFLKDVFKNNKDLISLMSAPGITKDEKLNIIKNIFNDKISNEVMGTIVTAIIKGRQNELSNIMDFVISEIKEHKKIGVAQVTSAFELDNNVKEQIKQKLLDTTNYNEIEIDYKVDAAIIGGLIIRIKDRVIDSSVSSKIEDIKRDLYKLQLK